MNTRSKRRDNRLLVWIAALALVLDGGGFSAFLTGYAPGTGPPTDSGYTLIVLYGIATLAAGCTFVLLLQRPNLFVRGFGLFAVAMLPLASILWSLNYYETFRATVLLYPALFSAIAIAFYFPPSAIIQIASRMTIIILLSSLATIAFFPAFGVHAEAPGYELYLAGAWRGIYSHKNQFGEAIGSCLIVLIMVRRMWSPFRLGLLALALISLAYSRSASPIAFSLFAFITAAFISPRCYSATGTAILRALGIILILVICVSILAGLSPDAPLELFDRDMSLTGRVPVWIYVLDHIDNPLIFGLGYVTGYEEVFYPEISKIFGPEFFHIHNGFIDAYIGLGLVGLSLILYLAFSSLRNAMSFVRSSDANFRDLGRFAVVLILYYLYSSLTDVILWRGGKPIFPMAFLLMAVVSIHRLRQILPKTGRTWVKARGQVRIPVAR